MIGFVFALLVLLCQPPAPVHAQAENEQPEGSTQLDDPIQLRSTEADSEIRDRLIDIYQASEWFTELQVVSEAGIVTLDGNAEDEAARDWAGQVARDTEGVAVVINRLQINVPPAIDSFSMQEEVADLWKGFIRLLPLIGIGLLVLITSVFIARLLSGLIAMPIERLTDSKLLQNISRKLVALLIVLAGLIIFLNITGLTAVAVTIVSGTGILGLIMGFAFRDIAENFLASILMSVQTPFRLGDAIEVAGHTGVVHKVTSRGTILVDFDGNHIQIANAIVYKSTIKNFTANPKRRLHFILGIGYDASVKTAQNVALGVMHEHPAVLNDPEPLVLVDQLGASTINLKIYYWIDGNEHSTLKVQSAIMRRTLRAIEQAGISLPDESREIIFPNGVPVTIQGEDTGDAQASAGRSSTSTQDQIESERDARRDQNADTDLADHVTEAEGDLSNEVDEIKEQAAASREVEGGDILESEE